MSNKFVHAVVSVILFSIPVALASHSGLLDVTIGGILNAIYLYLSQKVNPTAPIN